MTLATKSQIAQETAYLNLASTQVTLTCIPPKCLQYDPGNHFKLPRNHSIYSKYGTP